MRFQELNPQSVLPRQCFQRRKGISTAQFEIILNTLYLKLHKDETQHSHTE